MSSQWPEPNPPTTQDSPPCHHNGLSRKSANDPRTPHVILTSPPYVILNGVKDPVWGRSQSQ